eukprot:gene10222-11119_t
MSLEDIRFIPFHLFISHGITPRYPRNSEITVPLNSFSTEDYEASFIVYVSHNWLRSSLEAEGWDGKPHPDTPNEEKYHLIVKGVQNILDSMTDNVKTCYLWYDYSCLNQDNSDPAEGFDHLDTIMEICDIIFTPILDKNDLCNVYTAPPIYDYFTDYQCPSWIGQPFSYLSRSWCRLEMFYALNVPIKKDNEERKKRFKGSLRLQRNQLGRRPHFLYSTRQSEKNEPAILLDPLVNSMLEKYHPLQGEVTKQSDREKIEELFQALQSYIKPTESGYIGEVNENGKPHGRGRFLYANGDIYDGEWNDGERHGKGRQRFVSGDLYEGDWTDGIMQGKGKYSYVTGDVYEGDWREAMMHGIGTFRGAEGDVYEGEYDESRRHGKGKDILANGTIYEGVYYDDERHGKGKITHTNGIMMYRIYERGELIQESVTPFEEEES